MTAPRVELRPNPLQSARGEDLGDGFQSHPERARIPNVPFRRSAALLACLQLTWIACAPTTPRLPPLAPPTPPTLDVRQTTALIPSKVADRAGWAADTLAALAAAERLATASNVCQVLAVVEQESGFRANPEVANLAGLVRGELDRHAARFGPLGKPAIRWLLGGKAPGQSRSFEQRLAAARTEADVDRVFRDLVTHWRTQAPLTTAIAGLGTLLFADRRLDDFNPITTAGSMQVAVRWAVEHAGDTVAATAGEREAAVRELLYTRAGGLRFGVARLLADEADYDDPVYRFADFNAGPYASRNAALQEQLSTLLGVELALDGDLLIYERDGSPADRDSQTLTALLAFRTLYAPEISERTVRREVRREKQVDFEASEVWRALRRVYRERTGRSPPYARIPQLVLSSPKLSRERTTEWFARAVDRRYDNCLARATQG